MISSVHKFIYIHVPKTGGNSIQERLVALSDDEKTLGGHRDGVDRFEVNGPQTRRKHQTLGEYSALLPNPRDYKVAISVRHPLARAISYYFSPHRWMSDADSAGASIGRPEFNVEALLAVLPEIVPISDFLRVKGRVRKPDFVIRFESLEDDFAAFVDALGLPTSKDLPRRNVSAASAGMARRALKSKRIMAAIHDRYAEDFKRFGYK